MVLGVHLLLAATAEASGIDVDVTCPAKVVPDASFPLEVRIVSRECEAIEVRLISSLVGNAAVDPGGTPSGEVGVFGPTVAGTVSVPAAVDLAPPGCGVVEPAETTVTVPSAHVFPVSFAGVQARQFLVADVPGTSLRDQDVCAVPEPAAAAGGVTALVALFFLRRLADKR